MSPYDLDVWLYGIRVAVLRQARTRKMQLQYTEEAFAEFRIGQPVLSISMPLLPDRYPPGTVGPWLDGLLPEGEARTTIERTFGVARGDTYGLLQAVGRDCAGAIVIQPAGSPAPPEPGPPSLAPVDEREIAAELANLGRRPLGSDELVRVSLPGQQPKLLLARTAAGGWGRPESGAPSTHILKPQDERLPGMARNEAACVAAAGRLGLGAIDVAVDSIAGRDVLIVARYDRLIHDDGSVQRLHQEDLCQALGLPSNDDAKYQQADRPPRYPDAAEILDTWSADGQQALLTLARAMTFNVVIGNADAHAKNISFIHQRNGTIEMAPLYDVASTIQYPTIDGRDGPRPVSRDLALWIGEASTLDEVTIDDLVGEARSWGLSHRAATTAVNETLTDLPEVVDETVAQLGAADRIAATARARAGALISGRPAGRDDPTMAAWTEARGAYDARRTTSLQRDARRGRE